MKKKEILFVLKVEGTTHDGKLFSSEASLRQYCKENGIAQFSIDTFVI